MLMYIRDRATGWIAWIIVILICIPFALWGINEYFGPEQNVAVAEVNGEEIGYQEFQRAYSRTRNRIIRLLGGAATPEMLDEERLRNQTMEQLVDEQVMLQAALSSGMRISDEQLADAINNQQAFRQDGKFSQAVYENYLLTQGYSPVGFEFELRRDMLMEQMGAAISNAVVIPPPELDRMLRLQDQKRRYRALTVRRQAHEPKEVDEGALKAYFEANRAEFDEPEKVKVLYVEVLREDLERTIAVEEAELQQRYESQKDSFKLQDQREASHILASVNASASDDEVKAAEEAIRSAQARLRAGESFAEVAKAVSQDPGSASSGGELGWFSRGVMDPEFEEAAFALREGEVSEPVRSAFGFHLIKVSGVRDVTTKPFEEVRAQLEADYRREQAEQEFFGQAERLANAAFESPDSLDAAAAAAGVKVKESPFLTRSPASNPEGIGREPQVVQAAFSTEVLTDGNNSELIEIGNERIVVLRKLEHVAAQGRSFDAARQDVTTAWKAAEGRRLASELGEALVAKLKAGEDAQVVADEVSLTWSEPALVGRRSAPAWLASDLFSLPRPAEGATTYLGIGQASGNYAVVGMDLVEDGEAGKLAESARDGLADALTSTLGRAEFAAVVKGLRRGAEVRLLNQEQD